MNKTLILIVGLAVGYVAGTAAGRGQFNKIKATVDDMLNKPQVKKALGKADAFIEEKAPGLHDVGEAVVDAAQS